MFYDLQYFITRFYLYHSISFPFLFSSFHHGPAQGWGHCLDWKMKEKNKLEKQHRRHNNWKQIRFSFVYISNSIYWSNFLCHAFEWIYHFLQNILINILFMMRCLIIVIVVVVIFFSSFCFYCVFVYVHERSKRRRNEQNFHTTTMMQLCLHVQIVFKRTTGQALHPMHRVHWSADEQN